MNGSTTPPSGSGGRPSHRRDLARVPGGWCSSHGRHRAGGTGGRDGQAHEAGDPGTPAADGFLKKVMKLHDWPEK